MYNMDYTLLLFFGFVIAIFGGTIIYEKLTERKERKIELKLRRSDSLLRSYYAEATNDRNDGWWKLHYTEKYNERLKKLKSEL